MDVQRTGKPRKIEEHIRVANALANEGMPPTELGGPDWTARIVAEQYGITFSSRARIWCRWMIQLHRTERIKFSTVPAPESKFRDVVGLNMPRPENALVVSIGENVQIQALSHTSKDQSLAPGPRPAADPRRKE